MGKSDGFLLYGRQNVVSVSPEERIGSFNEFHDPLSIAERRKQAARCMNCGVPFCQSGMKLNGMFTGCPLHNLIPEWNDMLYLGNMDHALSRLLKTSPFPEFTGRVCPALCEAACTCSLNGESVTVHDNELAIIEDAFSRGVIKPQIPGTRTDKRIAVVGSGPAGLAAAQTLNRRGHTVDVYEKSDRPGGLLMYGIPNMKLDKSVIDRRIKLMQAEGVTFRTCTELGKDISLETLKERYDAVLLCCGSGQPRDINAPGRDASGILFAVDYLTQATRHVLDGTPAPDVKDKDVVIIGGGDTGNDCAGTSIRLGCKSITQIEMMPMPPRVRTADNPWPEWPRVLKTDYGQQEAIAVFGRDPRIFETTVQEFIKDDNGHVRALKLVKLKGREPVPGSESEIPCDVCLIAAGFTGCEKGLADVTGIQLTQRGVVDTVTWQTNIPGVFSAGDMRRGPSLVVWGISEGLEAAKVIDNYLMGYTEL